MSSKKIISINPDFFSLSGSGKKKRSNNHNKTQKKRMQVKQKIKQMSLKPNKIKKDLLRRIKAYQEKNGGGSDGGNSTNATDGDAAKDGSNNELTFSNAMESLDTIIRKHKKDKRKQTKERVEEIKNQYTSEVNNKNARENMAIGVSSSVPQPDMEKNRARFIKPNQAPNEEHTQRSSHNLLIKPDPPYGCLKGGRKKTYRQYMKSKHNKTLKHRNNFPKKTLTIDNIGQGDTYKNGEHNSKSHLVSSHHNSVSSLSRSSRKDKLDVFKQRYLEKEKIKRKKYKKKYRIHTYKKTYKLGKKKERGKVDVLIKNNTTRKKVKRAVKELEKTPLLEVKRYLKQKGLIKTGSNAPEYVMREIYKNSMLAGDISNKNNDVLVHNYFTEES